jgi:hypothetical protein
LVHQIKRQNNTVMATVYKVFLTLHILGGFTALISGLVPMFAHKGGKAHNFWGTIYYYGMLLAFATTLVMFGMKYDEVRMQFLSSIGVFSFYHTFSGVRILKMKKSAATQATLLDHIAAWAILVVGMVMLGYAIVTYLQHNYSLSILFGIFGGATTSIGYHDILLFAGKKDVHKTHWFFHHLTRMMGSYAATLTAFCVNVVSRHLPDGLVQLLVWFVPGMAIGAIITLMTRHYKKKMRVG